MSFAFEGVDEVILTPNGTTSLAGNGRSPLTTFDLRGLHPPA